MFHPPLPIRLNDSNQLGISRPPAEQQARLFRVGDQVRWVSRSRRLYLDWNLTPRHPTRRLDHFEHRIAFAITKIDAFRSASGAQVVERLNVRAAQIRYVY